MKKLIRDNPFIAFSILLPLAVVILFCAATFLPHLFVDPPAHDFIVVDDRYSHSREAPINIEFSVDRGQVFASVVRLEGKRQGSIGRVYRFDHASSSVREIVVVLPENARELPDGARISIPELEELRISAGLQAPDGYEYQGHSRRQGFITEIFGGNRSRSNVTVAKDGAIVRVRLPSSESWYPDSQFLGWVIETSQ